MFWQDILGDKGRAALHICVKVSTRKTPSLQLYGIDGAYRKIENCFRHIPPFALLTTMNIFLGIMLI
jgi:hypothetical protein